MSEFDKNYLGHNFLPLNYKDFPHDFKCNLCGIRVQYIGSDVVSHHKIEFVRCKYIEVDNYQIGEEITRTCAEQIIKNIIE